MTASTSSDNAALLSLADLARHFSLPESTIRYYCKRFAPFFEVQGAGRRRRYSPLALDVIAAVIAHMPSARTATQVEALLRERFATADASTALLHAASNQYTGAGGATTPHAPDARIAQLLSSLQDIAARIDAVAQDNAQLREEVRTLRLLLHSSEQTHQDDLSQIRTWVGRLVQARGAQA